jgi:hypothetical protein
MTTRPSIAWKAPMAKSKPEGYDATRLAASGTRIDWSDVERFVFEDAPGIDSVDSRALAALRVVWNGTQRRVKNVVAANNDPKVLYFVKFCEGRELFASVEVDDCIMPIFTLQTDLYSCWDACVAWKRYRTALAKSNLDNGWLQHGIRLLARYQEFKLFGTQSWWQNDEPFPAVEDRRAKWEARKKRRRTA